MSKEMVDKDTGLVKSPFTITKSTDGSTFLSADLADVSVFTDILVYAVPLGQAVRIEPFNYFYGFYYATDATTKITAGQTRILKANSNRTEQREVWLGVNSIFKDIGDKLQRPELRVPVTLNASQKLVVQVKSLGVSLDQGVSDFIIEATQFYEEI